MSRVVSAAADDGGDDAGEGFDRAHGGYGVGVSAGRWGGFGGRVWRRRLRASWRARMGVEPRVRFLPVEGDGVALDALGAGDDGEREEPR